MVWRPATLQRSTWYLPRTVHAPFSTPDPPAGARAHQRRSVSCGPGSGLEGVVIHHRLTLETEEVVATIQSLHASIARWLVMSYTQSQLRDTSLVDAQRLISKIVGAYQKTLMAARVEGIGEKDNLVEGFLFGEEVWELIDDLLAAESWTKVPAYGGYPWAIRPETQNLGKRNLIMDLAAFL